MMMSNNSVNNKYLTPLRNLLVLETGQIVPGLNDKKTIDRILEFAKTKKKKSVQYKNDLLSLKRDTTLWRVEICCLNSLIQVFPFISLIPLIISKCFLFHF